MAGHGDDFERDILDIIPERFDADADSRQARAGHRFRGVLTLGIAVVAVGGIVAAGWHFIGGKRVGGPGVPVIKADDRPIKTRPDERGGMQVPNQDKLVYERMEGEGDAKVERLLPPPEQPVIPPRGATPEPIKASATTEVLRPPPAAAPAKPAEPPPVKASPQAEVAAQPLPGSVPAPAAPTPAAAKPAAPAAAPTAAAPSNAYAPVQARTPAAAAPQVAAVPAPAATVAPAKPAAEAAPVHPAAIAKAPPPSGDFVIQLGALRSQDAADKEWGRVQKANADLLGALKSDIVRVELGEKGTFWRLRAGPLSEQAAKSLCTALKDRNQGCIVARK
ncbi:MAG: SPOR domain-containing protein [Solirubrobacterales bacterium]